MVGLEFVKGHGTGNDFVIVPDPDGRWDLSPSQVAALCDRRYGVGGDGLLRVVRARDGSGGWFMDYRNADGSVAEMCGNGVRVFARYLVDSGLAPPGQLVVGTRSGPVPTTVHGELVTAALDLPRVGGPAAARVGGHTLPGTVVDCGNPHLVCPVPDEATLAGLDLGSPPGVDREVFPAGVNVELIAFATGDAPGADARVRMRVHERGVGETWSCGSGACAAASVVLRDAGRPTGTVVVEVPGGTLRVALTDRACELTGPAVLVARGTLLVPLPT